MHVDPVVLRVHAPEAPDLVVLGEIVDNLQRAYAGIVALDLAPELAATQPDTWGRLVRAAPSGVRSNVWNHGRDALRRAELQESYLDLLDLPTDARHMALDVSPSTLHAVVPREARMRLVRARFNSPGIFGFFGNRAGAEIVGDVLEHRRETRVLKAGGTEAEVERRQAEADIAVARARAEGAAAVEREATAKSSVAASDVEAETHALQQVLLQKALAAIEQAESLEVAATLMASTHQAIDSLDRVMATAHVTAIEVVPADRPALEAPVDHDSHD